MIELYTDEDVRDLIYVARRTGILESTDDKRLATTEQFKTEARTIADEVIRVYTPEELRTFYRGEFRIPDYALARRLANDFLTFKPLGKLIDAQQTELRRLGNLFRTTSRTVDLGLATRLIEWYCAESQPEKVRSYVKQEGQLSKDNTVITYICLNIP